jgi:mitochondrial fission protein ELM1
LTSPVVSVFIGGDTSDFELTADFADALASAVQAACESVGVDYLVTTSRRTPGDIERRLDRRLEPDPRCRLLLRAGHDPLDGTMEGMLGAADVAVVTGESISMVSEACASGRRVLVVPLPRRASKHRGTTKTEWFLSELSREGRARVVSVPELAEAIPPALKEGPGAPLQTMQAVSAAISRLL